MGWNEPDKKDPWGTGGRKPTDLDDLVRNIQQHLKDFLKGRSNRLHGQHSGGSPLKFTWLIPLAIAAWLLSGLYRVDSAEQAVVLRFGSYVGTTGPGLHWHWPWPLAQARLVNVAQVRPFSYANEMLTEDGNIVQIAIAVQYLATDPYQYLFGVRNPDQTLGEVAESAIRQVVGENTLDFILGTGQGKVARDTQQLMQSVLDRYKSGLKVLSVNLQKIQPPVEVQDAFDDVNKAREDKQRLQNEAQAYANSIVPRAKGQAAHIIQDAEAYQAKVVAEAQGSTSRFNSILAQYKKAPAVTRERLYIDGVENVLQNTDKIVIDPKIKGSLLYLPLDKLFKSAPEAPAATGPAKPPATDDGDSGGAS